MTFNEGFWLKKTVDSLISSCKGRKVNYEIIIVDDGSTDGSTKFITNQNKEYSKVKLLRNEVGLGVAKARNLGAKSAKGEVFMFVDAHMIFPENLLSKVESRLKNSPKIAILGIHCLDESLYSDSPDLSTINIYTNSDRTFFSPRWIIPKKTTRRIFRVPFVIAASLIVRREVFEKVHGFGDYIEKWGPEDRTFSLTAYLFGFDCYFDPNIWIWHRYKKNEELSNEVKEKKNDIYFNIISACYCLYDRHHFDLALNQMIKGFPSLYSSPYYKKFVQKKSTLNKYKSFVNSHSTRTVTQFESEFSEYLPYLVDEGLALSFKHAKEDPDKALSVLSEILSHPVLSNPNENKKYLPYIYFRLAFVNGEMKKEKFSTQKKYLEKSIRHDHFFIPSYVLYARYLSSQKEYKHALSLLFSAKEISRNHLYQRDNYYTDQDTDAHASVPFIEELIGWILHTDVGEKSSKAGDK
ncbi:glycosyltransferase family 2 protein [Candidatus Dojkabacteria bacterium]|uniref:Glycosyltransferase family 2 protein n=1 Tax=Candidatus Dojkabacteria bacterium TaxID=2099670 RepID=A0A955KV69_9BACT|nr:glycosyltransferase family 2 protein [Candidatus Dojkabacteria bacterium]MCB9790647.1 glycosyltransferase family 2 protein [Candidatus Nomurabacteria bacterium]